MASYTLTPRAEGAEEKTASTVVVGSTARALSGAEYAICTTVSAPDSPFLARKKAGGYKRSALLADIADALDCGLIGAPVVEVEVEEGA